MSEEKKKRGRPKGSKNKSNEVTRMMIIQEGLIDTVEFKKRMKQIKSPAQYCQIQLQLMKFVLPQLRSIELTGEQNPVNIVLPEMSVEQLREILGEHNNDNEHESG